MPAIFQIDQNSHVTITTPIPQLEKTSENEQLYRDIAQVFEAMLPAFRKAEIVGSEATAGNSLQVIVKAQSMKYVGRWHTEGSTENIIAAGVYYAHVDERLEGGALKFCP
ncbi:unnamed protein product, partial [Rotaria sp. Silwood1]